MNRSARYRITLVCLLLLLALGLSACALKTPPKELPKAADVVAAIAKAGTTATEALLPEAMNDYLALDAKDIADQAAQIDSSRATPEVILAVTAKDKAAFDRIKTALADYKTQLADDYRDYRPAELPKIEAATLRERDLQLVMAVVTDQTTVDKALAELWK